MKKQVVVVRYATQTQHRANACGDMVARYVLTISLTTVHVHYCNTCLPFRGQSSSSSASSPLCSSTKQRLLEYAHTKWYRGTYRVLPFREPIPVIRQFTTGQLDHPRIPYIRDSCRTRRHALLQYWCGSSSAARSVEWDRSPPLSSPAERPPWSCTNHCLVVVSWYTTCSGSRSRRRRRRVQ
jgi:hypothetical protein